MNSRKMDVLSHLIRLLFIGLTMFVSPAFAQIYHVKDMNTEQIKALDRKRQSYCYREGSLKSTARICRRFRTAIQPSDVPKTLPMRL